jgi:hypothetical protein
MARIDGPSSASRPFSITATGSGSVATPSGLWTSPNDPHGYEVGIAGEYVLITLRNLPLHHEGIDRFEVSVDAGAPVALEVPAFLVSRPRHAAIH